MTYLWSDIFVTLGFCRKNPPSKRWPFVTSLRNSPWDFHSELRGDGRETRAGLGWWWGKPKRSGTWRGLAGLTLAKQPLLFFGGECFWENPIFLGKMWKTVHFLNGQSGLVKDVSQGYEQANRVYYRCWLTKNRVFCVVFGWVRGVDDAWWRFLCREVLTRRSQDLHWTVYALSRGHKEMPFGLRNDMDGETSVTSSKLEMLYLSTSSTRSNII